MPRILGVLLAAVLLASGQSARAATVSIGCPSTAPVTGETFVSEVSVDTGSATLGAYTLVITYDKSVVTISSIAGGATAEFTGAPITNAATFTSGTTRISAFNGVSRTSPTGLVSVARVTFTTVGTPQTSSPLGLQIITLSDTDGNPIVATAAGCTVVVAEAPTETPTLTAAPPTDTPTNTPVPPTDTPSFTPVPATDTPTDTPIPPTNTQTFTPVPPSATLTNTPVPTTDTPTNTPVSPTNTQTFTPVPPSATPTDTAVPSTETPTSTPVPPTNTATSTPIPPTNTQTFTPVPPSATPTNTAAPPTDTPTGTPVPSSATPTSTPVPPTETPSSTPVPPSPTPTDTPVPPTNTQTFTPVPPSATLTNTPVPPTNTPSFTPVPPSATSTLTVTQSPTQTPTQSPTLTTPPTTTPTTTVTNTGTPRPSGTPTATPSSQAACGNGVLDPGEECDDGNLLNGDGCSATCMSELIPGGGSAKLDCTQEWLTNPVAPHRDGDLPRPRLECVDDDPACDFGRRTGDNACTFHIALCFNVTERRFTCSPAGVARVELREPQEDKPQGLVDTANRDALEAALAGLGGVVRGQCTNPGPGPDMLCAADSDCRSKPDKPGRQSECQGRFVVFDPALDAPDTCTTFASVVVPLKRTGGGDKSGKTRLKLRVTPPGELQGTDTDSLELVCQPRNP